MSLREKIDHRLFLGSIYEAYENMAFHIHELANGAELDIDIWIDNISVDQEAYHGIESYTTALGDTISHRLIDTLRISPSRPCKILEITVNKVIIRVK